MRTALRAGVFFLAAVLLAFPAACGPGDDTPEGQVRAVIKEAEEAAEEKNLRLLKGFLSESYTDRFGNDRATVVGLLRYEILRSQEVHLLVRVAAVSVTEPGRAEVTAYVAMAGQPLLDPKSLEDLRADLLRFDVVLADEGERTWRVTKADWTRAAPTDFLLPP